MFTSVFIAWLLQQQVVTLQCKTAIPAWLITKFIAVHTAWRGITATGRIAQTIYL